MFLGFYLFISILCVPNASRKYQHDTGSDQLYVQQKLGLVSVVWDHAVSAHGSATAKINVNGLPYFGRS